MFTAAGIILGTSPMLILVTILAYTTFALMLIGIWYMMLKWTGLIVKQGILILVYLVVVVVIILPGLVPAIIIGVREGIWYTVAGVGILVIWQTIAAAVCFLLSKGILHNCDMPTAKLWK
jgi:hypothetical protein